MSLPKTTIYYAIFMMAVGILGFLTVGASTSLIPFGLGLLLLASGILAAKEIMRMHMMHAAAMISILAIISGGFRIYLQIKSLINAGHLSNPVAFLFISAMVIGSLIFTVLCVRSFIQARLLKKG